MRTIPETQGFNGELAGVPQGVRAPSREGAIVSRARQALASGPMPSVTLLEQVLSMRGTPAGLADRIVTSVLGEHDGFALGEDGRWRCVAAEAPLNADAPQLSELRFAVVDVETTGGGHRTSDRVTEIAVVPVDAGRVGTPWRSLVNPGRPIPPGITRLTGITDAMVSKAPSFGDLLPELLRVVQGRVFVAHNAAFDWGFVNAELTRAEDRVLAGDRLCTVKLARLLLPGLRRRSLDALSEYFGIRIVERHRACGDAVATASILCRLLEIAMEQGHHTWPQLSARLDRRTARARRPRSAFPRPVEFEPAA